MSNICVALKNKQNKAKTLQADLQL